ncbi:hypothetical protein EVJ58_g4360 [Rhodofomes roseus]|uniref:Uncharacterized protein n=1 Tax=Rhodofomes roseus TaxID=34475 RepID=A0A4Y9YJP3_9APHY|nr:hypothetical protein EVJ58_g4360 [Rhodofomes roseus]
MLNKLLPTLAHLTDIRLDMENCCSQLALYDGILRTLNKCTFSLSSFECRTTQNEELKLFLERQTRIESLIAKPGMILDRPEWRLAYGALPRLKWLHSYDDFFVDNIHARPRMITHLDWSSAHAYVTDMGRVLQPLGRKLVDFAYRRSLGRNPSFIEHPSAMFRTCELPKLKHFKVVDQIDEPAPCLAQVSNMEYMSRPDVKLETFTWVTLWPTRRRKSTRLALFRGYIKAILAACRSLRRFYYVERDDLGLHFIVSFTLAEDGQFVEQDEARLPV